MARFPAFHLVPIAAALLAVICSPSARAGDSDFQTWQWLTLPFYESGNFRAKGFFETRFNDDSTHFRLGLVSPQFDYKISPTTRVGLNYTFLRTSPLDDNARNQQRLELQASDSVPLNDSLSFTTRNRIEFRWIDGLDNPNNRIRIRPGFEYKLENLGPLTGLYANNEFFINLNSGEFSENRLVPIGLEFSLSKNLSLDLFCMIQLVRQPGTWDQNYALGTHLKFSF